MAHTRGTRFARSSSRRQTDWSEGPLQVASDITAPGVTVWAVGQAAVDAGLTLIRVRGIIQIVLTAAASPLDGFRGIASGLCIVSENAAGIGATAIPSPVTDVAWDGWLWHSFHHDLVAKLSADVGFELGSQVIVEVVDSKAMRKFTDTNVLVGVTETVSEVGTSTMRLSARTRILTKLA